MKRRANVMFSCADIQVFLLLPTCVFSNESETPMMPLGGLRRIDRRLIHRSAWRDCMKSSWRSPDGGSSVAPNTKIEPSEAVFRAWWSTASTPIRSFHTVSPRTSVNSVWWPGDDALPSRHRDRRRRDKGRSYGPSVIRAFSVLPPRLPQPPLEVLRASVQHPDHPVGVVPGEELLPRLGDEARPPAVLVAQAYAADQHLRGPAVVRAVVGPPLHLDASQPVSSPD